MTDSEAPLSDDELLSAYLDGELDDDQTAHVERLLAASPETRQILAELRAVGDRLRALPAQALGGGFAERVLQRAERAMLTSPQAAATAAPVSSRPLEVARFRGARPWIYAAVTLAAGLMLMVFGPHHASRDQQLAEHAPEVEHESRALAPAADSKLKSQLASAEVEPKAGAAQLSLGRDTAPQQPDEQELRRALNQAGLGQIAAEVADRLAPDKEASPADPNGQNMLLIVADVDREAGAEENLRHLLSDNSISIEDQHRVSDPRLLDRAERDKDAADRESDEFRRSVSASVMVVDGTNLQLDAALNALDSEPQLFQNVQKMNVPMKGRMPDLVKQRAKVVPPAPAVPASPAPSPRGLAVRKAAPLEKNAREMQEEETSAAAKTASSGKKQEMPVDQPAQQAASQPTSQKKLEPAPTAPSPATTASTLGAAPATTPVPAAAEGYFLAPPTAGSRRAIIILRSTSGDKPVGPPAASKAK